jgi:hypothetical protein
LELFGLLCFADIGGLDLSSVHWNHHERFAWLLKDVMRAADPDQGVALLLENLRTAANRTGLGTRSV